MFLAIFLACVPIEVGDTAEPEEETDDDTADPDVEDNSDYEAMAAIDSDTLPAGSDPCRPAELVWIYYVIDGDTAWVDSSYDRESVRFIGVNTPEIGWDGDPSDCYGDEAAEFAVSALEGTWAWLTFDGYCYDSYDRTLAFIHTGSGSQGFFQRQLLQGGYAETLHFSGTDTFRDTFDEDEAQAREAGRGLWSECY